MTSGIYKITNTSNGYVYIGASMEIEARLAVHRQALRCGRHDNPLLQRAWDECGESAFAFRILEKIADPELIKQREFHHLQRLRIASEKWPECHDYNRTYSSNFRVRERTEG